MNKQTAKAQQWGWVLIIALILAGAAGMIAGMFSEHEGKPSGQGVWSEEHGHYH